MKLSSLHAPLRGIRVLDLSRILAGPWASQILGDLGAKVTKIEYPGDDQADPPLPAGDETRRWGPPYLPLPAQEGQTGPRESAYYLSANRNKETLWIDFKTEEGQKKIQQLCREADVVIENFLPGTLIAYQLDYLSVAKINPKIIYLSITGYGQTGPKALFPGFDYIIQAECGLMSITGENDQKGGSPLRVGIPVIDLFTGCYGANAIQAALIGRTQSGYGTHIDLSLFEVGVSILANQGMNFLISGNIPLRQGNTHPNIVPYQVFKAKNGSFILGVGTEGQYRKLIQALKTLPNLVHHKEKIKDLEKFKSNSDRIQERAQCVALLEDIFIQDTVENWLILLNKELIPCGKIQNIDEVFNLPSPTGRDLSVAVTDHYQRTYQLINHPFHFSHFKTPPFSPPPVGKQKNSNLSEQ